MNVGSNQLTLNNIINFLASLAAGHKMISAFGYGPIYDLTNAKNQSYPYLWVEPQRSIIHKDHIELKLKLFLMDEVSKGNENRNDVHSDTFGTLLQLRAYIYKDLAVWLLPSDDSDIEPLYEKFDNDTTGWSLSLNLKFDWRADVCTIPGLYLSGTTFQTGCDFINVSSTNYLPLTGGQLTGDLSGTTIYMNDYYSGGTELSTVIYDIASSVVPPASNLYWTSGSTGAYSLKTINDTTTDATGNYAIAEGCETTAQGDYSHAEGNASIASGTTSHAEGASTQALGVNSHSEGDSSIAQGDTSHAEGNSIAIGLVSHAEGYSTTATGDHSHSEGDTTQANGISSHTEGFYSIAQGNFSHAEGQSTETVGYNSHSEGNSTIAYGNNSHVEGDSSITNGDASHAEGYHTTATGDHSHSEGAFTQAIGEASHAEGLASQAVGAYSHAGGVNSIATGSTSFVFGNNNKANGNNTAVLGGNNITGTEDNSTYVPTLFVMNALTDNSATNLLVREATGEIRMRALSSISTVTITGGTYNPNTGVTTLYNSTGGTISISGYYTGFTGGLVSGATQFTGGLTANTLNLLSATTNNGVTNVLALNPITNQVVLRTLIPDNTVTGFTFNPSTYDLTITQNNGLLPLTTNLGILASDMVVTGGTYNPNTGVATFTNNSGGTFQVTGFLTGHTDTYVTGMTFSSNTLTLYQTQGNASVSQLINNFSSLSANSFSATTYYGLPVDVLVTGGTYTNGTAIFTNNTGGTFSVTGFSTSTATAFTGGTVTGATNFTGGLTGNTFSATTAIIGNSGNEGGGITVNGTTYDSSFKVSDINGNNLAQTILHRHSTTLEPLIVGARSNSNNNGHTGVTANQNVFSIYGVGYIGNDYKQFGQISLGVDSLGSLSNTSSPGIIKFLTTPNGSVTPIVAVTINSQQQLTANAISATTVTATTLTATTYQGIPSVLGVLADGQSGVIATGVLGYKVLDFPGIITGYDIVASTTGYCQFDIWKIAAGTTLPTSANTITSTNKPTLSSGLIISSTNLSGWTTTFAAGDIIAYNVVSASTVTKATLTLKTLINTQ